MGVFHPFLEPCHDRTCRVDDVDAQCSGLVIGRGRFAVSTDEKPAAAQPLHFGVCDRMQPQLFEPLYLDAVVHDVAQRIDRTPLGERPFGLADGPDDAETET